MKDLTNSSPYTATLEGNGAVVERVYVSGYLDLEAEMPTVRVFPRVLLLDCGDRLTRIWWNPNGSLSLDRNASSRIEEALLDEPSIHAVFIDVTENYFGENQEAELISINLRGGNSARLEGFKFIEIEFSLGLKLQIDPCWSFGFTLASPSRGA